MNKFLTMLKIEGKLALRGIDGIFFGVVMPVAIAAIIGMIGGQKEVFSGAEYTYIESSFAALITVGICATAFMGIPLSIADYRDKKILKHYFVTPVSPAMLLLVQVAICAITAIVSSVSVYLVMKFFFGYQMKGSKVMFLVSYVLVMAAMYGIGMLMASVCKSVKMANLVCTIVYFPMLFLSGATIPYEILPKGLQNIANVLPLTQGIKLLKGYSLGLEPASLVFPIVVMVIFAVVSIAVSIKVFRFE
jgi:ABC-2 type transport system permease protein